MYYRKFLILLLSITVAAGIAASGLGAAPALLKPGDIVGVTVEGETDLTRAYTLDDEGNIDVPLTGNIKVGGMSPQQAQTEISARLAQYLREPQVRVELLKTKGIKVSISGDVEKPGDYESAQEISLRDSLAFTGGARPTADLASVTIVRGQEIIKADLAEIMATTDPSKDIKLQDGDRVTVPSRIVGSYSVFGSVRSAGTYPLLRGTKVVDAIKNAGGPQENARVERVKIVHKDNSTDVVDMNKLLYEGQVEQNRVILPDDTIILEGQQTGPAAYSIMGAVYKPGRFDLTQRLTLTQAIANSGGFTGNAQQDKCTLIRRNTDGTFERTALNFKELFATPSSDEMLVQDGDVINVPEKGRSKGMGDFAPFLTPLLYLLL